tara:strand:+ start:1626 stop:1757 length:132 start_codon:yes stop_codon:yes gene_type:complete
VVDFEIDYELLVEAMLSQCLWVMKLIELVNEHLFGLRIEMLFD